MDVLVMAGQLILGLSILVILHELGHFVAARAFGIKVEKFYLFFDAWNVSLFKYNYKGVEYGIGWLPLGGYVKIAGMIDESMDTDQMAGEPQPWEFRSKPAWQRLIVMLGGVTVNIILGILIFWILTLKYGESYIPNNELKHGIVPGIVGQRIGLRAGDQVTAINGKPLVRYEDIMSSQVLMGNSVLTVNRNGKSIDIKVPASIVNDISDQGIDQFISRLPRIKFAVDSLQPGSGAQKAGIMKGDSILSVNGKPVAYFDEMQKALAENKGKQVQLGIKRNQQLMQINAQLNAQGQLGFYQKGDLPEEKIVQYGFFQSLPVGAAKAWDTFSANATGIGKMITGKINPTKAISSPLRIATLFGAHVDWLRFWSLVGLLSMALALMNLLPIPALDGGHALFLIIEMIKGRPLSEKFLERAQIVGFVVLITLMVFAFGNDIIRLVHHK